VPLLNHRGVPPFISLTLCLLSAVCLAARQRAATCPPSMAQARAIVLPAAA